MDENQLEMYFGYIMELIKRSKSDETAQVLLYGVVRTHWYQCRKRRLGEECLCETLVKRIDQVHQAIEDIQHQSKDAFDFLLAEQAEISALEDLMAQQEEEEMRFQEELERIRLLNLAQDNVHQLD